MFSQALKYSLLTLITLSSSTSSLVTAPEREDFTIRKVNVSIIPILESRENMATGSDISITKFVSKNISLADRNYAPPDLAEIGGIDSIGEAGRKWYLRQEARDALWNMARDFTHEFWEPLIIISGYRSATYQQRMWDLGKCSDTLCAPPWYSEHQLGLAIDIFDATTASEYYKNSRYRKFIVWLKINAYKYGWHQSYQNGKYIDAYEIEPWHWRYLGIPLATKLQRLGMTYTEYMRLEGVLRR